MCIVVPSQRVHKKKHLLETLLQQFSCQNLKEPYNLLHTALLIRHINQGITNNPCKHESIIELYICLFFVRNTSFLRAEHVKGSD